MNTNQEATSCRVCKTTGGTFGRIRLGDYGRNSFAWNCSAAPEVVRLNQGIRDLPINQPTP